MKDLIQIAEENGLEVVEVREAVNTRDPGTNPVDAIVGFTDPEQAKRIAEENGLELIDIWKSDGDETWKRMCGMLSLSKGRYVFNNKTFSDDKPYRLYDNVNRYIRDVYECLSGMCDEYSFYKDVNIERIRNLADAALKVVSEIKKLTPGEIVLTKNLEYEETLPRVTVAYTLNGRTRAVAAARIDF